MLLIEKYKFTFKSLCIYFNRKKNIEVALKYTLSFKNECNLLCKYIGLIYYFFKYYFHSLYILPFMYVTTFFLYIFVIQTHVPICNLIYSQFIVFK